MLKTRRILSFVLVLLLITLTACSASKASAVSITNTISKDEKFGAAVVNLTPDDMQNAGFELGDSCDVTFSNGYTLYDVPYYNGYYVKIGEPVIVAYPNTKNICVTTNTLGIWDRANLENGETVTITLNAKQKYNNIQDTLGQVYSVNRDDYSSDEEFCNFRALTGGNLKENFLYRGASPVDNSRGRAAYTDKLLKEHNVQYIVDLADSQEDIENYISDEAFASEYANNLINQSKISLLDLGASYQSDEYKQSVAKGLTELINSNEGPVYIHCMEGKDRTGFICMLLEALAGATYDEMLNDYMITYQNYYLVSKETTPTKYDAIAKLYFDSFIDSLNSLVDDSSNQNTSYVELATAYLSSGGMTDNEIEALIQFITAN